MAEGGTSPPPGRTLVIIPTYDEAANLEPMVARVRAAAPAVDLLVVDDASPDGTGAIADRLAAADQQVHVLHRPTSGSSCSRNGMYSPNGTGCRLT